MISFIKLILGIFFQIYLFILTEDILNLSNLNKKTKNKNSVFVFIR